MSHHLVYSNVWYTAQNSLIWQWDHPQVAVGPPTGGSGTTHRRQWDRPQAAVRVPIGDSEVVVTPPHLVNRSKSMKSIFFPCFYFSRSRFSIQFCSHSRLWAVPLPPVGGPTTACRRSHCRLWAVPLLPAGGPTAFLV